MTAPLRIGVALPHAVHGTGGRLNWPDLEELARQLDGAGFDSLWVCDHFFSDLERRGGPPAAGQLDAMVLLPALAVATSRIRLGTLVLAVGFRPPSVLAKAAASLDRLSGGRFDLGLGAGWMEAEYAAAGLPFPSGRERLAELEEAVALIRAMVAEEQATVTGDRFSVDDAPNLPQPAQPHLPILVAAFGPQALRTAARVADTWNIAWRYTPEEYGARVAAFEQACEDVGRDPAAVGRSLGLLALVGEDRNDVARRFEGWRREAPWLVGDRSIEELSRDALVGTASQVAERIEQYRNLGVTDLVLNFSPLPFGWSSHGGWDIVADEILPGYVPTAR